MEGEVLLVGGVKLVMLLLCPGIAAGALMEGRWMMWGVRCIGVSGECTISQDCPFLVSLQIR